MARSVLIPLDLIAAASVAETEIHKKPLESEISSSATALLISSKEMRDIKKIVEASKNSGLFIKGFTQTIKNGTKEQKDRFLGMLLGAVGASLFGNI